MLIEEIQKRFGKISKKSIPKNMLPHLTLQAVVILWDFAYFLNILSSFIAQKNTSWEVTERIPKLSFITVKINVFFFQFLHAVEFNKALKMESGYICLILIIFLISIIPLGYTISWFCSKSIHIKASSVSDIMHTNSQVILPNDIIFHDDYRDKLDKLNCRKKICVFILQFLVTICM